MDTEANPLGRGRRTLVLAQRGAQAEGKEVRREPKGAQAPDGDREIISLKGCKTERVCYNRSINKGKEPKMTYEDYCDMVADEIKDREMIENEELQALYEWQQEERDLRFE